MNEATEWTVHDDLRVLKNSLATALDPKARKNILEAIAIAEAKLGLTKSHKSNEVIAGYDVSADARERLSREQYAQLSQPARREYRRRAAERGKSQLDAHFSRQLHRQ